LFVEPAAVSEHNRVRTLAIEIRAHASAVFGRKRNGLCGRQCTKDESEGNGAKGKHAGIIRSFGSASPPIRMPLLFPSYLFVRRNRALLTANDDNHERIGFSLRPRGGWILKFRSRQINLMSPRVETHGPGAHRSL